MKMKSNNELNVNGTIVRVIRHNGADYVCITDIAALKNPIEPKDVVKNWMRSRATISFLGLWEKLHNPDFKGVDFDPLCGLKETPYLRQPNRQLRFFTERTKTMMKKVFMVGIVFVISGCSTYSRRYVLEKYGCEYGRSSLYDCAHSDCHPVSSVAYGHDGESLQVFQVLKNGVLVAITEPKYSRTYRIGSSLITEYDDSSKDLNIFVETGAEYVDKEFLLPGLYQYIGTYSYEAVNGSNRTVRRFKQLE